ncbi:MAG: hypothetical protein AB1Z23_09390 [Eubacteriales bacterium]
MKKKIKIVMIFMILASTIFIPAKAETGILVIDLLNAYDDMEISYIDGYTPEIANSKVNILMPLVIDTDDVIDNSRIKVTFDTGSSGYSPFYTGDYYGYYYLEEYEINNSGDMKQAYLIDYKIPLLWSRVNGSYPVVVNAEYKIDGETYIQEFIVYVVITDGKQRYEYKSDKEPRSKDSHAAPDIIISEYYFSEDIIKAGDEFQLYMTLENTSDTWHAYSIRIDYDGETTDIISSDNVGSLFIEELEDKEETGIVIKLRARKDAEAGAQKITINLNYMDNLGSECSSTDTVVVEIQQPIRVEYDDVNISSKVNAGDSMPISMQVFNMGKSSVYNVLVSVEMPGVIPDGSAYLGNMESGESATAEIYAFFGTLDMGKYGLDTDYKYGASVGTVTLSYEDEYGEVYTETIDVKTTIERPVFDDLYSQDDEEEEEVEKMSSWWISVGILVVIAAFILGITSYRRKINQLKREYGHLDD